LMLGRPSVSFYTDWGGTSPQHKHLADLISLQTGVPAQVYRVAELAMTSQVLPKVEIVPVSSALTPAAMGVS